ncbi:hypothetical protein EV195_1209 [Tenacibaculum skagerrakense]|uniref:Uncharacterized protein n=1 Tax=Tenacibaculum skagerrakense TaxID=186571 RepID=A0A4R2NJ40_9FLAO|nr:hypothetical protein [Tenacibaculum skagerrakense]TCP21318.1 hypothetical protein EV195_1209 [Tenacibaculum skagerrakense]
MKYLLFFFFLFSFLKINGQVFPGTPVSGFPSGTTAQINAIANPVTATLAYSTDEKVFYYYDGTDWVALKTSPSVYVGSFIINAPGGSTSTSFTTQVTGIPFQPSQVTFTAYANIESFGLNNDNQTSNNDQGIANSFGNMTGFARNDGSSITQNVIYIGGSGNSINDISRYSSNTQCIGIRYGNQNGDNLGVLSATLNSFDYNTATSTGGFTFNISYTIGTTGNASRNDDILNESLVVLYTAYK